MRKVMIVDYQNSTGLNDQPFVEGASPGRPTLIKGVGGWHEGPAVLPAVVRGAHVWLTVQAVLSALIAVPFICSLNFQYGGGNEDLMPMILILLANTVISMGVVRLINRRTRSAWTWVLGLAILGLTSFPIGMAVSIYILSSWFKPATRAWFGRY